MRIKFVEIQNFRKLKSVRIDFSEQTTLFVGANNSGKTSAMIALRHFLINPKEFTTNDFTLSNWIVINEIGAAWEKENSLSNIMIPSISEWENILPTLDIWLDVEINEIHYVRHLIPTLDWGGGNLGVRLKYEPKKIEELQKEYLTAANAAKKINQAYTNSDPLSLWPKNIREFLDRNKLRSLFEIRAYLLDPDKCTIPQNGIATPQKLPFHSEPLDVDPFKGLIRIDEISAQRGFSDQGSSRSEEGKETVPSRENHRLSTQFCTYYSKHLDPLDTPVEADLDALRAIEAAQKAFDLRLDISFLDSLKELESLNYPGVTDPKMKIVTRLRPTDGLNHSAAVQYEVLAGSTINASLRLPEEYNGLGYQNLISMVFRLMSFRDAWMRVGKADKNLSKDQNAIPPLHLVLLEEPEAHLHAQVQQVFVRKAYDVLRNHIDLKKNHILQTQLIVSTHSSHIAHESQFSCLRYFRRLPSEGNGQVPTSAVINLSEVFGTEDETARFVSRYLKATHCDLFFADAAILVEGQAERMLVPHFIRQNFVTLNRCYVTLLEIGGSHAHRLRNLIKHLGLITLIITDLDSVSALPNKKGKHTAVQPELEKGLLTGNSTLKKWHPKIKILDKLLRYPEKKKIKKYAKIPLFSIRIAYQIPIPVQIGDKFFNALATTFEDALIFENLSLFSVLNGNGIFKKIRKAIKKHADSISLGSELFKIVRGGDKAEFALDLLCLSPDLLEKLQIPKYIAEGLSWLQDQLISEQQKILFVPPIVTETI